MRKFKNVNTGVILSEKEYEEMLKREHREMWEKNDDILVQEMKEDGKSIDDFLEYMEKYYIDADFELIELELNWEQGNKCYFVETKEGFFYYNDCKTLSYAQDNNSPEEYIGKFDNLEEAELEVIEQLR